MKEKMSIITGAGITLLVIITIAFYLINKEAIGLFDITSILIISIIVLTSTYVIWDRFRNIRVGLPVQDERLKLINYKAGFYGFIAAIWSAIGSNFLSIFLYDQDLRGGLVVAAVVLVSGMTFMISYLIMAWKGN